MQPEEANGMIIVRAAHREKVTDKTLPLAAQLLFKLHRPVVLDLSNCQMLENVDGLRELTSLTELNLNHCQVLQNVDGLKKLKALTTLDLNHCQVLQKVDALKELKALTTLDLSFCPAAQDVDAVVISLPNLQVLTLVQVPIRDRERILGMKGRLKSLETDFDDSAAASPHD